MKVVSAILLFCTGAWAAEGSLAGVLTDATGAVIPGASVTLLLAGREERRLHAISSREGGFAFGSVEAGRHELRVEAKGFQPRRREVLVADGEAVRLPAFPLELGIEGGCGVWVESSVPLPLTSPGPKAASNHNWFRWVLTGRKPR